MKKFFTYLLAAPVVLAMAFATSCKDPVPPVTPPDGPDDSKLPKISLEEDINAATYNSATVLVTVTNADKFMYTHYEKDKRPAEADIKWTEFKVDKDGEYAVEFKNMPTNLVDDTPYTFEAYACLKDSVSKHDHINFQTLVAKPVMVEDMVVSARQISFVAEVLKEHCDAFCYIVTESTNYDLATFKKDIEEGWADIVKESAVVVKDGLDPEKDYVIAIVPIRLNENSKFKEYAGSEIINEVKTRKYEMGQKEVVATLAIDEASLTFVGVNATITRPDTLVAGYYFGAVKKADLDGATLAEYLVSSDWLYAGAEYQENYRSYRQFDKGELSAKFAFKLNPETEYELFVIAVDKDGFIGKATSVAATTPAIEYDQTITAQVVDARFDADMIAMFFTLSLSDKCTKVFRLFTEKPDPADVDAASAEAQERLIGMAMSSDDDPGSYWLSGDANNALLQGNLYEGDFVLYTLPVSEDGSLGVMGEHTFTIEGQPSEEITFDPSITMDFTIADNPVHSAGRNFTWEYVNTPVLDASAGSSEYGVIYPGDGYCDPAVVGVEAAAKFIYLDINGPGGAMPSDVVETIGLVNAGTENREAYIVYIPIGTDGVTKGLPVMKKVSVAPGHKVK